jgi:hypothetical protein
LQQNKSGKLARVPRPTIDGELWLSVAWNLAHQTARESDWKEEMPYRISYIDTSMLTDEQITEGILRTEEFTTEPAALARACDLLEDLDCMKVLLSDTAASKWYSRPSIEAGADRAGGELRDNRLRCSSCHLTAASRR